MSEEIILNADPRERTGTNKARVIRKRKEALIFLVR
jgi:hypothetical protein